MSTAVHKTDEEITAEIAALTAMKPTVLRFSKFHDDHHAAIDAQIEVLTQRMDSDAVAAAFDEAADNVREEALDAHDWMHGLQGNDMLQPSVNWQSLVR